MIQNVFQIGGGHSLGYAVRAAREAQGLSQEDLAELAHTSLGTVRRLEAGGGVHLRTAAMLAKVLGGRIELRFT